MNEFLSVIDIDEYYEREVKPHLPDSWMDRSQRIRWVMRSTSPKIFTNTNLSVHWNEISQDLLRLDKETEGLMKEILV